jgi:predicted kinase
MGRRMSFFIYRPQTFVMLCGLPCSGKSSFVRRFMSDGSYTILSTDDIIEKWSTEKNMTYKDAFDILIRQASLELQARFSIAIAKRHSIIIDQTNMSREKRVSTLSNVPDVYHKVCFVFPEFSDHEYRLEQRNKTGNKVVPLNVLESMKKSFVSPSLDEGWDSIHHLSETFVNDLIFSV